MCVCVKSLSCCLHVNRRIPSPVLHSWREVMRTCLEELSPFVTVSMWVAMVTHCCYSYTLSNWVVMVTAFLRVRLWCGVTRFVDPIDVVPLHILHYASNWTWTRDCCWALKETFTLKSNSAKREKSVFLVIVVEKWPKIDNYIHQPQGVHLFLFLVNVLAGNSRWFFLKTCFSLTWQFRNQDTVEFQE